MRIPIRPSPSYGNLGPLLHRFRDIAEFFAPDPTPIPPYFRSVSECSHWTIYCLVGVTFEYRYYLELFGLEKLS